MKACLLPLCLSLLAYSSTVPAAGNMRLGINGSGPINLDNTQTQQLFTPTLVTQKRLRMKLAQPVLCTSFSTTTTDVAVELVNPQEFFPNPLVYPPIRGLSGISYFVNDDQNRGLLQLSSSGSAPAGNVACCILTPAANALCLQGNTTQSAIIESELFADGFENFVPVTGPDLIVTVQAPATVAPGATLNYDIVIRNEGVSPATSARIREYFPTVAANPPALTTGSWTCSATPGSNCTSAAGTGIISAAPNERLFNIAVGGTVTFSVTRSVLNSPPPMIGSSLRLNAAVFARPQENESRVGNNQADATVTIQTNTAPTITDVANQTIDEDGDTGALAFTVDDAETAAGALGVSAVSSNQALIPNANLVLGGSGANRTITATPAEDANGTATITVTVSDGSATSNDTFTVTVDPINDAPSFTAGGDLSFDTGAAAGARNPDWASDISQCPPARPTCEANEPDIGLNFVVQIDSDTGILSGPVSVGTDGKILFALADAGGGVAPDGLACIVVTLNDGGDGNPPNANSQTQGPFRIEVGNPGGSCLPR